jgi:hypothetical protein
VYIVYSVYSTVVTNEVIDASLRYGFEGIIFDRKISTHHSAVAATESSSIARSRPTDRPTRQRSSQRATLRRPTSSR